ncbi:MAG: hypothetical protein AB7L13_05915 [Acidimicrobiia bacterium]
MTVTIDMLQGGHGDALVLEYGPSGHTRQLLIDAGTFHAWDGVRASLLKRRKDRYEVFVITHVDEDHIGGAISVLDDPDLKQRVDHVWFNGFIHCQSGGNVLGPVNGEQLTKRIVEGGFKWNDGFPRPASNAIGGPVVVPSAGALPSRDLPGGGRIVLLSPTGPKLKSMAKVWKTTVENAGIVAGAGTDGHTTAPSPRSRDSDPLPDPLDRRAVEKLAAENKTDSTAANGSSIAFVFEAEGKRVLFGADAHAPVLAAGLKRYAAELGEPRVRLDLVKLSHHGSNANISTKLLELIDCKKWLVSTNGDNFAHPDDAALAKVIVSATGPVTFFCNYKSARTGPWGVLGRGVGATFKFPTATATSLKVKA